MNAPIPAGALAVATLKLADITRSPTNPRQHFNEAALAELAANIKDHGVIQPILVRPNPKGKPPYEIVFGERRFRASQLAGLVDIPAFWRELTDKQVLEMQVIENLQREDVHPLEEAEGYDKLMHLHGYTPEALAEKVGKSKSYIFGRLKLRACVEPVRKAFYDGTIEASTALLIARIPASLQPKALKEITQGKFGRGDAMSVRVAQEHIHENYMLILAKAPFSRDDETLVAKAGSCAKCPKRTGNQRDLFSDVKSADVCTDLICYEAKTEAHTARQVEQAKAAGRKVITGKDAEKIAPYGRHSLQGGYVDLDEKNYSDAKSRTWRQILGKDEDAPKPMVLVSPRDKTEHIDILPLSTIAEHLKAKGVEVAGLSPSGRVAKTPAEKLAAKREKLKAIYHGKLFDAVRSGLTLAFDNADRGLLPNELAIVAAALFDGLHHGQQTPVVRLWRGEKQNEIRVNPEAIACYVNPEGIRIK